MNDHGEKLKTSEHPADSHPQDTYLLLRSYALNNNTADVDFELFVDYTRKYVEHYGYKYPRLKEFSQNSSKILATYLHVLAEEGRCSLELSGDAISIIHFPQIFYELIKKAYQELEQNPELPFPTEDTIGVPVPSNLVSAINIKTDFVDALVSTAEQGEEAEGNKPQILRLVFPENINSMIVTSNLIRKKLMEYAVYKMRSYLSSRNNAGYAQRKLLPALKGNDHILRESINAIVMRPGKAINSILDPSDFSFRFWAHFVNLVIQEYREKKDMAPEEYAICQAAYLLSFYNVYYKGQVQRANEKIAVLKMFETSIRKAPFAFTLKDLYGLKDKKGLPLIRKSTRDVFIEFLENKTKTDSYKNLPELLRIKTVNRKEYYIHRDLLVPLFIKKMYETAEEIKAHYRDDWEQKLKQGKRTLVMTDDREFARDLQATAKERAPLFSALLNFNLLFLAREETKVSFEQVEEINRCFDEKQTRLKSLQQILGLNRKELFDKAKLHLPLWERIAILKPLLSFFQNFLHKIRRNRRESMQKSEKRNARVPARPVAKKTMARSVSDRDTNGKMAVSVKTDQRAAFRKAVQALKVRFIGRDKTIPQRLDELIEKWNPLFDPQARQDLVEDVNAMIRDYLRGLKRALKGRPPNAERIQGLAEKLAFNPSFERIKKKEYFTRYIEVYMIKLLGER